MQKLDEMEDRTTRHKMSVRRRRGEQKGASASQVVGGWGSAWHLLAAWEGLAIPGRLKYFQLRVDDLLWGSKLSVWYSGEKR